MTRSYKTGPYTYNKNNRRNSKLLICGFSMSSLIRWMWSKNWTYDEIVFALEQYEPEELPKITIVARKYDKGVVAKVDTDLAHILENLRTIYHDHKAVVVWPGDLKAAESKKEACGE